MEQKTRIKKQNNWPWNRKKHYTHYWFYICGTENLLRKLVEPFMVTSLKQRSRRYGNHRHSWNWELTEPSMVIFMEQRTEELLDIASHGHGRLPVLCLRSKTTGWLMLRTAAWSSIVITGTFLLWQCFVFSRQFLFVVFSVYCSGFSIKCSVFRVQCQVIIDQCQVFSM